MLGDTAQLLVKLSYQSGLASGIAKDSAAVAGFSGRIGGIKGAVAGIEGAASHAAKQVSGLVRNMGLLAGGAGALGVGLALKSAVTSAMDYQSAMEQLKTQTGATQQEVDNLSQSVLELAKTLPQGPEELAAGLYHIESAGVRGQAALDMLKISAQGAAISGADLESVTNALVGAWQSGVIGAHDLGQAMGTVNAIVGSGNMRMQELADSMASGVLATAKTFGATFQSVGAAIATMTDEGIPAIDAATRLRMSINLLGAPTTKAAKLFKSIGLEQTDLANAMRGPGGLTSAITDLHDHMVKAGMLDAQGNINTKGAQFLSGAFGGGRSSSAIMTLIGNYNLLIQKQDAVNKGAGTFGDSVASAMDTAKWKFATFQSSLQVLGIKMGNVLLPIVTDLTDSIGKWISDPANERSLVGGLQAAIAVAKELAGAFMTVFNVVSSAWNKIPGGLQQLLVGGFVANKAAGWLFGTSPLSLGKNLLGSLLGKVPGVGGVAAAAGLAGTPVYVTNWPLGFGVGGLGGALPGAAAAAGGLGIGTIAVGLAAGTAVAALGIMGLGWLINATSTPEQQAVTAQNVIDQNRLKHGGGVTPVAGIGPSLSAATGFNLNQRGMSGAGAMGAAITPLVNAQTGFVLNMRHGVDAFRDAVRQFGKIVHSSVFKKAQAVREAGGFTLSRDVLIADLHKGVQLGTNDLVTAQAMSLAAINHLRTDTTPNLRSAASTLGLLKRTQAALPAELAGKLAPKIHSLEVAIDKTTAAIIAKQFTVNVGAYVPGAPKKPGVTHAPGTGPLVGNEGGVTVNANVSVSARDVNTTQDKRARWGATPTQVGAA
ncbi:MAG: phage tail tape measure protein [Elusimicrobia bacterium]|nr:phage tail tape measure protein [Elusimicrobiota bacterium]